MGERARSSRCFPCPCNGFSNVQPSGNGFEDIVYASMDMEGDGESWECGRLLIADCFGRSTSTRNDGFKG